MTTHDELDRLASEMRARGEDGLRLRAVERARTFKRTWVEMAEVLVRVRARHAYLDWGYQDFHTYCEGELRIKRATAEKLTVSYATLEQHAPNVLQRDGVAQSIPAIDAVDYFARALRESAGEAANDGGAQGELLPPEVVDELRHAVFEEGAPVAQLRRRFDPVLRPTSDDERRAEGAKKASAAAKKLSELIAEVEGLDADLVANVHDVLEGLRKALDAAAGGAETQRRRAG